MQNKQKIKIFLKFLRKKYKNHTGAVHRRSRNPFQVLVSCILSQRTTDINTEKASMHLFKVAKTPEQILKLKDKKLQELIRASGFYRQKSKKIKQTCKMLLEKYSGKVPSKREELLKLPGVGWKTSSVVMSYCFDGKIVPVDTHVNVVSKRLGFADEKDNVETVREKLENLIPPEERYHTHLEIIHFGKEICRSYKPKCKICELKRICKYYKL